MKIVNACVTSHKLPEVVEALHRIEGLCRNAPAQEVVSVIESAAHTGLRGDGKIYVCSAEKTIRIATGERDEDAD